MRTLFDRRLALVGMALSTVLTTGCGQSGNASMEAPSEPPRNVRVMNVRITDLNEYLDVSGPVEPLQASDLSTEEPGISCTSTFASRSGRLARIFASASGLEFV